MKLPKELTTVTPLSRGLALFLFFCLPIFGFFFGMRVHQLITPVPPELTNIPIQHAGGSPFFTPVSIPGWKTYTNTFAKYSLQYPATSWKLDNSAPMGTYVSLLHLDPKQPIPPEGIPAGGAKIEIYTDLPGQHYNSLPASHYKVISFAGRQARMLDKSTNTNGYGMEDLQDFKEIAFTNGNYTYSIAVYMGKDTENLDTTVNQILSTFQLTQ